MGIWHPDIYRECGSKTDGMHVNLLMTHRRVLWGRSFVVFQSFNVRQLNVNFLANCCFLNIIHQCYYNHTVSRDIFPPLDFLPKYYLIVG